MGEWRSLHNEELHSLYRSSNIVRVIKSVKLSWTGHVAKMEEDRNAFKIVTGVKPTRKSSSGRSWLRCVDNVRIYLKEMGINTRN